MKRVMTFLKRFARAGHYGFVFKGTRFTRLPPRLWIAGKCVPLSYPDDPTLISDINNIILDDEYGLRSVRGTIETVVDIGANIGLFSVLARHYFPAARIAAYEPDPLTLQFTRQNLRGLDITIYPEAVLSEDGFAEMIRARSSRLSRTRAAAAGSIPAVSLATVLERAGRPIDLLKLDCEGGEWDILNCREVLRSVSHIRMEYHLEGARSLMLLHEAVRAAGFEVSKLQENNGFGVAWLEHALTSPRHKRSMTLPIPPC